MSSLVIGPDAAGRSLYVVDGVIQGDGSLAPRHTPSLRCSAGLIALGHVNAHTHLYSGLAPLGLPFPETPPPTFVGILEQIWWRLDRALDAETLRASARYYLAHALLAGTTAVIDHHESPPLIEGSLDILAEAFDELGIRGVLTYGATERNDGRAEGRRGLEECARFIGANTSDRLRGMVGLHAAFTCSDETLRRAGELARELGVGVHVHVAEAESDNVDARERGYGSVYDRLVQLDALPPGSLIAHGVHLDPQEVRSATSSGHWFVQNPQSNAGNRVGFAAVLAESERVALGTDGYPADMRDEQAAGERLLLEHGQPAAHAEARFTRSRALLSALFDERFTDFAPGSRADLVIFDAMGDVLHVLVDGELVVRDGALVRADLAEIEAEAERVAPRLWAAMSAL